MKIFKERDFLYKLIFIGVLLIFIFFIPVTPLPAAMRRNIAVAILVLILFAAVIVEQFRIGLTKYIINEKKELVIYYRDEIKLREPINKITSVSDYKEVDWGRRRKLFRTPKSKIHLLDGRSIPIYIELKDENNLSVLEVLKTEYKIVEK